MSPSEAGKLGAIASKATIDAQYQERVNNYYLNPTRCIRCNIEIEYKKRKNKFCSHSCAATILNPLRVDYSTRICLFCKELLTKKSQKKYCSTICQSKHLRLTKLEEGTLKDKSLKNYLIDLHGYKCTICGIVSWNSKPLVLELEHIDGNSENNSISNVCLLCPNCHSQTPTYKGRNVGNGRHYRRVRYAEGKSY